MFVLLTDRYEEKEKKASLAPTVFCLQLSDVLTPCPLAMIHRDKREETQIGEHT